MISISQIVFADRVANLVDYHGERIRLSYMPLAGRVTKLQDLEIARQ